MNFLKNDVEQLLERVIELIPSESNLNYAKWFIDLSSAPRPFFLSLLAFLRRNAIPRNIHLFHPSGNYDKVDQGRKGLAFTSGFDRYIWIPWLWGRQIPSKPWAYIFLLGFEGNRSYEIFDRFEPESAYALIAKPGYQPGYPKIARDQNKRFIEEANPDIYYAHGSDVVLAWNKIKEITDKIPVDYNICIVPLCPRPHALAGGLAALCNNRISVLYLLPRRYVMKDNKPGNELWLYEISL